MAVVKPLYKTGDKFEISAYRSISLLPIFAKIFEKAMYGRLSQHLQTNKILAPEQYAFRKGKPTEDVAFRLTVCLNLLTKSYTLEEYSVIYQRLLTV